MIHLKPAVLTPINRPNRKITPPRAGVHSEQEGVDTGFAVSLEVCFVRFEGVVEGVVNVRDGGEECEKFDVAREATDDRGGLHLPTSLRNRP